MSALSRSLGVVAVAAAAAVMLADPRGGTAAPAPATDVLACVPADAALFVHVDAQALYTSKLGKSVTKAFEEAGGVKDLAPPDAAMKKEMTAKDKMAKDKMGMPAKKPNSPAEAFREFERVTGIKEADVASFTLYMPKLKGPGDEQVIVFGVTLSKPYDKAKLLEGMKLLDVKIEKEVSPGVYQFSDGPGNDKPRLVLTDPTRILFLGPKVKDLPTPRAAGATGPLAAAIAAAPKTAATFGLNFANLPDEVRGDNLPPQVEPFKPILQADAVVATLAMGDRITLDVRAVCAGREKAIEAEKAMGVARTLFQTLLNLGKQEIEKTKEPEAQAFLPLLKTAQEALKAAQFGNTDTEAFAKLSVPADIDISPLVKAVTGVRSAASRSQSQNNLKQIGLAMHNYHDTHGRFPAAAGVGRKGKLLLSWRVAILPYVEQDALYREFKMDEPWDSEHNKKVFDKFPMPKVYAVPGAGEPTDKTTHYQVFRGNGALFETAQGFQLQNVTDGTSNTIMVATAKTPVPWTKPDDIEFDPKGDPRELLLFVENVCSVAFADGSVRAIRKTVAKEALLGAITRAGGEVINLD